MKCTKCGMEVSENASFCPACGNKLFENQSDTYVNTMNILQNNTFAKFSHSKAHIVAHSIGAVIFFIYFIACITLYIMAEAKVRIRISSRRYIAFDDDFKGIFIYMAVVTLICVIIYVVRCIVIHKLCLCVYNDRIAGVSAKNVFFATEDFEVKYSDIININQKKNLITIETGTKKYICLIQDAKKAYEMINSTIKSLGARDKSGYYMR